MKTRELREISSEDLFLKEKSIKKDLYDLYYQRKMGAVEKPARFRVLKRDIARIKTILRERALQKEQSGKPVA